MKLPTARGSYDQSNEAATRRALEQADLANFKKGQNVELARDEKLILRSPDGSQFYLAVANDGTLTAEPL